VHRPRRCCVRKLSDRVDNPAPDYSADGVGIPCEILGSLGAFHHGLVAVALAHQGGDAPNVDLRYQKREPHEIAARAAYDARQRGWLASDSSRGVSRVIAATRVGDRLFVQVTAQPRVEVFPEGDDDYFLRAVDPASRSSRRLDWTRFR
jgi:hypothetical protein